VALDRLSVLPPLPSQGNLICVCDASCSGRNVVDVADAKFALFREFAHRRADDLVDLGADLDPRVTVIGS